MTIRDARPEDARAVAEVHVASWRSTYRGIFPDDFLDGLSVTAREAQRRRWFDEPHERSCFLVAETDDRSVVGFAMAGPERDGTEGFDGEVYAIYLLREAQGRGAGRLLFTAALERLAAAGFRGVLVWVLTANASCAFYEHMGGVEVTRASIEIAGAAHDGVAYGWRLAAGAASPTR